MIDTWERAVRLQATLASGLRLAPQARTDPKTLPASSRPGGARRGKSDAARTQLPFSDRESLTAVGLNCRGAAKMPSERHVVFCDENATLNLQIFWMGVS